MEPCLYRRGLIQTRSIQSIQSIGLEGFLVQLRRNMGTGFKVTEAQTGATEGRPSKLKDRMTTLTTNLMKGDERQMKATTENYGDS